MSETSRPSNEIDDYIAAFSYEERQEYAAAETALDLTTKLYLIRQEQGPGQQHTAARSSLKQQAISRLEIAASTMQLGTLQRYLGALGYRIEISVIDNRTRNLVGKTSLSQRAKSERVSFSALLAFLCLNGRCVPLDCDSEPHIVGSWEKYNEAGN